MHTRRDVIITGSMALAGAAVSASTPLIPSRQSASNPGPRAGHVLAFHAGVGSICLVGGDRDATFEHREQPWFWNGRQWTTRTLGLMPPAATLPAVAADPERKSLLQFGGITVLGYRKYGPPTSDLWELGPDAVWRKKPQEGLWPSGRHHLASAFDAARGRFVVYGGTDASEVWDSDVWEWDRLRWHRIQTPNGPGERVHHAMAYDSRRRRIVLRGGFGSNRTRANDTWEWDGKSWHLAAADGPSPGDGYRLAFDEARGVTVMFGGNTCLWDGAQWTRVETPDAPSPRSVHAMAYDPTRQRVVMYGGSAGKQGTIGDLWEWDGVAWKPIV